MRLMYLWSALLLSGLSGLNAQTMDWKANEWSFSENAVYRIETKAGQNSLFLNGRADLVTSDFQNGTVEVDIFASGRRSFGGITFRGTETAQDEVYLRLHKGNQVDAVQYTPIYNGESNWQLYQELQAKVAFRENDWNQLRLDIKDSQLTVFVNGQEVLQVAHLRSGNAQGTIGLFGLFGTHFANLRIQKATGTAQLVATAPPQDPTIIHQWELSEALPYSADLDLNQLLRLPTQQVATEASGLLPVSKYVAKSSGNNFEQNQEDVVLLSVNIQSDSEQVKHFLFDYSDRIILRLNGQILYKGNNTFRAKGLQYMGHLMRQAHSIPLPLKAGANRLECFLIERANGWGIMGQMNDLEGIELIGS